jgi:transcriptional regulator with XRE-family HTH domain
MSILKVSIRQIKAARALLDWSQTDLAKASGVSEPTIKRLEAQDTALGGRSDTGEKITRALEAAGITFVCDGEESPTGGAGVRLTAATGGGAVAADQLTAQNDE